MSVEVKSLTINGRTCRISQKGQGRSLFWLPSHTMALKWSAFHDALAEKLRLVMCPLPGFAGSEGHEILDDHLSWCLAARDLLLAAGFKPGDMLIGSSVSGAIAADVAALWPDLVGRLVLIAPFGLYDMADPTRDMFAVRSKEAPQLFCETKAAYEEQVALPPGEEAISWSVIVNRGSEAAARILWPFGETRLAARLHRIRAPTLLLWGANDKIVPPSYAQKFAQGLTARSTPIIVPGGGHLLELDRPAETVQAILAFHQ